MTTSGDTLGLILDSGGGINMLWSEAAARLRLPMDSVRTPAEDGEPAQTVGVVPYPRFARNDSIPSAEQVMIGRRLFVPNRVEIRDSVAAPDGFLGRFWFRDRIWVLDYLAGTLSVYPPGAAPLPPGQHQVPLGFAHNALGHRTTHFPRIRVAIAGDSIDMLFDTGATLSLTRSALAALADSTPSARGGSFVSRTVFDRWRTAHPDWRVIEHADSIGRSAEPIIEVPAVSVAGYTVGPSWWAARADANYKPYETWMDKPIRGSIGGSVFRYLRITLDYPHALATFERP